MFVSLQGFLEAVGGALGAAREAFGPGTAGDPVRPAGPGRGPAGLLASCGQAAQAFERESHIVGNNVTALGETDRHAHAQLVRAVAHAGAGRDRTISAIGSAMAEVNRWAALTSQPAGQMALIKAMVGPLEQAWSAINEAHAGASTHAAESARTAAAYNGVGAGIGATTAASLSPMTAMAAMQPVMAASAMPMSTMPLTGLTELAQTGGQYYSDSSPTNVEDVSSVDKGAADVVVKRAMSQLGMPYVWGGGDRNGPTGGGFDCSGLVQYAYAGVGIDLPRTSDDQFGVGVPVPMSEVRAGDLVFPTGSFGEDRIKNKPGHVILAIGPDRGIEASTFGVPVKVCSLPTSFQAKRILGGGAAFGVGQEV